MRGRQRLVRSRRSVASVRSKRAVCVCVCVDVWMREGSSRERPIHIAGGSSVRKVGAIKPFTRHTGTPMQAEKMPPAVQPCITNTLHKGESGERRKRKSMRVCDRSIPPPMYRAAHLALPLKGWAWPRSINLQRTTCSCQQVSAHKDLREGAVSAERAYGCSQNDCFDRLDAARGSGRARHCKLPPHRRINKTYPIEEPTSHTPPTIEPLANSGASCDISSTKSWNDRHSRAQ